MPAAFAHDLYGRKVYMEADPVIKRIIKKERYCFLLGVHGPDILFFYKALGKNKVNQKGVRMHGEPAAKLMERGRMLVREAETKDERDEMKAHHPPRKEAGCCLPFLSRQSRPRLRERRGEADRNHPRGDRDGVRTETFGAGTYASAAFEPHLPFKDHSPDRAGLIKAFR